MKKKFDDCKQDQLVEEMKTVFGADFWVKPGYQWAAGAVLWSGEGANMPDGTRAFNPMAYEHDPEEKMYILGVHKDLIKWSDSQGLYWESNDPGTYIAYPSE